MNRSSRTRRSNPSPRLAMTTYSATHTRTQTEEALLAEKERLNITLDSIGDGLITVDAQQRIELFNRVAQQLTGWPSPEAVGKDLTSVFCLINVKTRQALVNPVQVVLEQGCVVGLPADTALVAKDGTERIISSSVAPIRNRSGAITGAVLVFRDITRLRQAEEALKESREFAASLIKSSLDMIIAVDQQRKITEFNPAAERTFGYSREEVLGQDVDLLYADPSQGAAIHHLILVSGSVVQEVMNRRKNGEVFPVLLSASLLKNAAGETIGAMGISRDITDLKRAEEQRLRSEQLTALGRMAAALAHEINNPLQAIRSTLDLILDFPIAAQEREENLQVIRQEIEQLSKVTERVLRFARPAPAQRRWVSMPDLLQQTLTLANKHLQQAHIRMTTEWQDTPLLLAAPEQMIQVFLNLILNAIEATGTGGHLHIATCVEENHLIVSFINDGPIVPPTDLPHIFEPFFTTKPEGSGLGLYVSRNLVQQHGGTLTAENIGTSHGVRFTLRLPLPHPAAESPR